VTDVTGGETSTEPDEVFSDTKQEIKPKRYELLVEVPSSRKRSRLATEKTTSADNLTLGSPEDKSIKRGSSGLLMEDVCQLVSVQS
jgi:hypothetical protein